MNGSFSESSSKGDKGDVNAAEAAQSRGNCGAVVTLNSILTLLFAAYILAFCFMEYNSTGFTIGYGVTVFNLLFHFSHLAIPLALLSSFLILLLVVLDVSHWQGPIMRSLAVLFVVLAFCGLCAGLLLSTGIFEFAPLAFFVVLVPVILIGVALAVFPGLDRLVLFKSLFWNLMVMSTAILGTL